MSKSNQEEQVRAPGGPEWRKLKEEVFRDNPEIMWAYIEQAETAARIAALQKYLLSVPTDSPGYNYIKSGIEREIHFARGVSNG